MPPGRVYRLAFSPDRPNLAMVRAGRSQIELWDAAGTALKRELGGHTGGVLGLAYGPRGQVASGGEDRTVLLWDDSILGRVRVYRGHMFGVTTLAFRADGLRLASGAKDRTIKIWNTAHHPEGVYFHVVPKDHLGEWLANIGFSADSSRCDMHVRETHPPADLERTHRELLPTATFRLPPGGPSSTLGDSRASAFSTGAAAWRQTLRWPQCDRRLGHGNRSELAAGVLQDAIAARFEPRWPLVAFEVGAWFPGKRTLLRTCRSRCRDCQTRPRGGGKQRSSLARLQRRWIEVGCGCATEGLSAARSAVKILPSPGHEVATGRQILQRKVSSPNRSARWHSARMGRLAAGTAVGTVRVWDSATGARRAEDVVSLFGLTFSPDGRRLAANGQTIGCGSGTLSGQRTTISPDFHEQGTGHYVSPASPSADKLLAATLGRLPDRAMPPHRLQKAEAPKDKSSGGDKLVQRHTRLRVARLRKCEGRKQGSRAFSSAENTKQ